MKCPSSLRIACMQSNCSQRGQTVCENKITLKFRTKTINIPNEEISKLASATRLGPSEALASSLALCS